VSEATSRVEPAPDGTPLAHLPGYYAARRPAETAVRCAGESLTWAELHEKVERVARGLVRRGVRPDSLVSLLLPNSLDTVVAVFACYRAGAVPQPLSPRLTDTERTEILALAQPGAVLTTDGAGGADTVAGLAAAADPATPLPDAVAISWKAPTSGGSTGRPKIILAGSAALLGAGHSEVWDIQPGERTLITAPMHHNAPFATGMATLFLGGTLSLLPRFDPEDALAAVAADRITWLYVVPTMMRRIHGLPAEVKAGHDLSSLRSVWHVSAPCPPWLKRAWIDWLGAERIWELYAGTEAPAGCTINGTEWLEHPGSVGRPTWGEIRIVDEQGRDVPAGVPGEVYMRVTPGEPEAFRYVGAEAKELDGWTSLGDVGEFDAEGYLHLHDRLSDMILVGGVNVFPAEVENAAIEHPAVLSAAVIGLPDGDLGNRVHLIAQATAPVTAAELLEFLGQRLSGPKRPRSVEFTDQPLRDDTGKLRRSALRAQRLDKPFTGKGS
jgi:bile acid-coenzyme A ligase